MNQYTILAYLYLFIACLYITGAWLFVIKPSIIQKELHWLFPLLDSWHLNTTGNFVNLIGVAFLTTGVANLVFNHMKLGLVFAIILSGWECYLSAQFYFRRGEKANAYLHYFLHSLMIVWVGYLLLFTN